MEWLNVIGAIFGVAGAFGGIVGFLSYGRAKTIIELQRAEIEAREERYKTINEQYIECVARAKAAEEKAMVLENLVTQTPSIERLAHMQAEQHRDVIDQLSRVTTELTHLVETMSNNQEKERKRSARKPRSAE